MKLGITEIAVILLVVFVVFFVFRGSPRAPAPAPRVRRLTAVEIEDQRILSERRSRLRMLGGALLVVGLLVLASTLKFLDLILSWYFAAALIMVAGVVVLIFSARR